MDHVDEMVRVFVHHVRILPRESKGRQPDLQCPRRHIVLAFPTRSTAEQLTYLLLPKIRRRLHQELVLHPL